MEKQLSLQAQLELMPKRFLSHISLDCVIFGYSDSQLKVLLLKVGPDEYMLPGGFVEKTEGLQEAAKRTLRERTGLKNVFLKQFYTFGEQLRNFPEAVEVMLKNKGLEVPSEHWILQRFISIGYYALVRLNQFQPVPDNLSLSIGWHCVDDLPRLLMDHQEIIKKAQLCFREKQKQCPTVAFLLPEKFTMPELQRAYENVVGSKVERSRFQKTMLATKYFERLKEKRLGVPHRQPYLYHFIESF